MHCLLTRQKMIEVWVPYLESYEDVLVMARLDIDQRVVAHKRTSTPRKTRKLSSGPLARSTPPGLACLGTTEPDGLRN